jgi:hypothetical protein
MFRDSTASPSICLQQQEGYCRNCSQHQSKNWQLFFCLIRLYDTFEYLLFLIKLQYRKNCTPRRCLQRIRHTLPRLIVILEPRIRAFLDGWYWNSRFSLRGDAKSAMYSLMSFRRIFCGFRSLWRILLSWRELSPAARQFTQLEISNPRIWILNKWLAYMMLYITIDLCHTEVRINCSYSSRIWCNRRLLKQRLIAVPGQRIWKFRGGYCQCSEVASPVIVKAALSFWISDYHFSTNVMRCKR